MRITKFAFLFLLIGIRPVFSQQITGKIIDSLSLQPIPNVAVQFSQKIGVFSNAEGQFSMEQKNIKALTFSCLGYKTKVVDFSALRKNNFLVKLSEIDTNLSEVFIQSKEFSIDSLLLRVKKNIPFNYPKKTIKRTAYYRESNNAKLNTINFELDRSSLLSRKKEKLANEKLRLFSYRIKSSKNDFFKEFIGNFYSKKTWIPKLGKEITTVKSDSLNGLRFNSSSVGFSIDGIQKQAQELVLRFLDTTKTYKMKSGLFKLEDSVSIKEMRSDIAASTDSLNNTQSENNIKRILDDASFFRRENEHNFLSTKFYHHQLKDTRFKNNHWVYVVHFSPKKSKAKFEGTLIINDSDFAVEKVTYTYAKGKRGQHLNLKFFFGVKFSENIKTGVLAYKKNIDNSYSIVYANEKEGRYFYVNRSLKFIENSHKRNKVKFDIKLEGNIYTTRTFAATKTIPISDVLYQKIPNKKRTHYMTKEAYEKSNWKNGGLLKEFKNQNE